MRKIKIKKDDSYLELLKGFYEELRQKKSLYIYIVLFLAFGIYYSFSEGLSSFFHLLLTFVTGFLVFLLYQELIIYTLFLRIFNRNRWITIGLLTPIILLFDFYLFDKNEWYWAVTSSIIFIIPVTFVLLVTKVQMWFNSRG